MVLFKNMCSVIVIDWAFQVAQWVKNLPAMQDTGDADSLPGSEDTLEEDTAIHCSILAWGIL